MPTPRTAGSRAVLPTASEASPDAARPGRPARPADAAARVSAQGTDAHAVDASPGALPAARRRPAIRRLQQQVGNRATGRLLTRLAASAAAAAAAQAPVAGVAPRAATAIPTGETVRRTIVDASGTTAIWADEIAGRVADLPPSELALRQQINALHSLGTAIPVASFDNLVSRVRGGEFDQLLSTLSPEQRSAGKFAEGSPADVEPELPPRRADATPEGILLVFRADAVKTRSAQLAVLNRLGAFIGLHERLAQVALQFGPEGGSGAIAQAKLDVLILREQAGVVRRSVQKDLEQYGRKLDVAEARADGPDVSADDAWRSYMDVSMAAGAFDGAQRQLRAQSAEFVPELMSIGRLGYQAQDPAFAGQVAAIADRAQAEAALADIPIPDLAARTPASYGAQAVEWAKRAWSGGDFTNNLGGVVSGTASIVGVTLGGVIGSVLFSAFGALFGAVGVFLGARAAVRSGAKAKELRALVPSLSSEQAKEIAEYAAAQKTTKQERATGVAVVSGVAAAAGLVGALTIPAIAGVIGLAAATVATLGMAAAVAGVLAAAIGIGVVAWRWWHRRKKKQRAVDQLVSTVVAEATDPEHPDPEAQRVFAEAKGDKQQLRAWAESKIANVREDMAKSTVTLLVSGKPSEQLEAEVLVSTLGLAPDALRGKVAAGDAAGAVADVAGKLASW